MIMFSSAYGVSVRAKQCVSDCLRVTLVRV